MPDITRHSDQQHGVGSAPDPEALTRLAEQVGLDLPANTEAGRAMLTRLNRDGNRTIVQIALVVAQMRALFGSWAAWIEWGEREFGRDRKWLHLRLNAVHFLIANQDRDVVRAAHYLDASALIEKCAALDKLEPGELTMCLRNHDLIDSTRDEIRHAVKAYEEAREKGPAPPEKPTKSKRGKTEPPYAKVEKAIERLSALAADDQAEAAEHVHPVYAMNAGIACFGMAMDHLVADNWLNEAQYKHVLPALKDVYERTRAFAKAAGVDVDALLSDDTQ